MLEYVLQYYQWSILHICCLNNTESESFFLSTILPHLCSKCFTQNRYSVHHFIVNIFNLFLMNESILEISRISFLTRISTYTFKILKCCPVHMWMTWNLSQKEKTSSNFIQIISKLAFFPCFNLQYKALVFNTTEPSSATTKQARLQGCSYTG